MTEEIEAIYWFNDDEWNHSMAAGQSMLSSNFTISSYIHDSFKFNLLN